jgi:hypothetical protein
MSDGILEYQKQYINLLAKIGEIELIIEKNKTQKANLLEEVSKMYDILSAYSSDTLTGEDNGVLEQTEESG